MRRGERWLLCSPGAVLTAAALLGFLLGYEAYVRRLTGGLLEVPGPRPTALLLVALGALYGIHRARAFHPLARKDYLAWLAATPWRPGDPLPLGPVHLVARDLFVLVPLAAITALLGHGSWLDPVRAFLAAYLAAVVTTCLRSWWWGYALLLSLAGAVPLFCFPAWQTAWLVLVYAAVALGALRHGLRQVPNWTAAPPAPVPLGWPFDALVPTARRRAPIPARDAALYALLAGAWAYAVLAPIPTAEMAGWPTVIASLGVMLALGRWATYRWHVQPPLGARGRLASGRRVVPAYDRIYLAPAAILALGLLAPGALAGLRLSPALAAAVSGAATLFVALAAGPTIDRWRLTAPGGLSFNATDGRPKYAKAG